MADILVVDDDQSVATAFQYFLRGEGHEARFASNAKDALAMIAERQPNMVFLDVRMPGVDGLQALEWIRGRAPDLSVVVMTAYGSSQTSIDAIRTGAFDYLTKPLDLDELRSVIDKALAAEEGRATAGAPGADGTPPVSLVGESAAMRDVYKMIGRLATNDAPALIVGEDGTGKRLVCATVHDNSRRHEQPFASVDCSVMLKERCERLLFGGEAGTVELANVEVISRAEQERLAGALRDDRARAAPGPPLTARILATTSRNLADEAREGRLSWEFYQALSVITLRLPPLRERREDIPLLVRHFIQRFNDTLDRAIKGVDDRAMKMLLDHAWPGNVSELESAIKRACIVTKSDVITPDDVAGSLTEGRFAASEDAEGALSRATRATLQERLVSIRGSSSGSIFHDISELVERTLVAEALTITNGNQVKAAELLGVNRATLRKKLRPED